MALNLVFLSFILTLLSCRPVNSDLSIALQEQLTDYPQSTLVDIYKSFFQDEFGPGHLLEDTAAARRYLDYELNEMTSRQNYSAEPCGLGKNFYRVPLDLVKDSIVSYKDYLDAFIQSGSSFKIPDVGRWREKWREIVREIESMNLEIKDFDEDKAELEKMLEQGDYVVHHSESYSLAYDPHYRIMRVETWRPLNSKFNIQNSKFNR